MRYRVRMLDSVAPLSPPRLLSLGTYVQQEGCSRRPCSPIGALALGRAQGYNSYVTPNVVL